MTNEWCLRRYVSRLLLYIVALVVVVCFCLSFYMAARQRPRYGTKRVASSTQWGGQGEGGARGLKYGHGGGSGFAKKAQGFVVRSGPGWYPGQDQGVKRARGVMSGGGGRAGYSRTSGYYGRFGPSNVAQAIGQEQKFLDAAVDDALVSNTGDVNGDGSAINIAQGTTEITRVGRKCVIRSINYRYELQLPSKDAVAIPANGDLCRVIVYVDTQTNGAAANVTDILETTNVLSFNNLANRGRFRILMDRFHTLSYNCIASDGAGVVSHANVHQFYSFYKKVDLPIEFNSTAGAITEIMSNNINVLYISKNGNTVLDGAMRFRFTDS